MLYGTALIKILGITPEQAFFVNIGTNTMISTDIANGNLNCIIGIAPINPAEFIIFNIHQKALKVEHKRKTKRSRS